MRHEVIGLTNEVKIGLNGIDTSGSYRSTTVNESRKSGRNIMARSMSVRSAGPGRRRAKTIGLLIVFAAAMILVSGIALAPISKDKASQPKDVTTQAPPPGTPYNILGYSYDAGGAKLPGTTVTITDLDTGDSKVVVTDLTFAAYMVSLPSFAPLWDYGDDIQITGENGVMTGVNASIVAGSKLWLNVTLDVVIPEFPMVIVPVTGMLGLMAVVSLRRRGGEQ